MVNFLAPPDLSGSGQLLNFQPVRDALNQWQTQARQRDIGEAFNQDGYGGAAARAMAYGDFGTGLKFQDAQRAEQSHAMEQDQRRVAIAKSLSGVGTAMLAEKDPVRKAAMFASLKAHAPWAFQGTPGTVSANPDSMAAFLAGLHRDPLETQMLQAQINASRASASHAAGAERRAEALHPFDILARNKALEGEQFGQFDENKIPYVKDPSAPGGLRFIDLPEGSRGPYKDMKQRADVEEGLRKEVTQYAKDYKTIRDSSAQLDAIAATPSAGSDIAMLYSFMKILDPGSVVRESEYATAQKAAGIPERIANLAPFILSGQRLSPEQRQDFLGVAQRVAKTHQSIYESRLNQYQDIARRLRVDPQNVVLPEPPQSKGLPRFTPAPAGTPIGARGAPPYQPQAQSMPGEVFSGNPDANAAPVPVQTPAEAMRLPPGTRIQLPDGRIGTVPASSGRPPRSY